MVRRCLWITICLLLAACSLNTDLSPTAPSPDTFPAMPTPSMMPGAGISSDTGPFANETRLLDGVCFEYFASRAPMTWVWRTSTEMDEFFDEVEQSELCPTPISRPTFDFSGHLLVGAVQTVRGCDSAHIVSTELMAQPPVMVLDLHLIVRSGCDYELVEPLLMAVPRPAQGITVEVQLSARP